MFSYNFVVLVHAFEYTVVILGYRVCVHWGQIGGQAHAGCWEGDRGVVGLFLLPVALGSLKMSVCTSMTRKWV